MIATEELMGACLSRAFAEYVLGWTVYHYDKGPSDYYMLMDGDFNAVNWRFREGERATEEEAWDKDCPDFSGDMRQVVDAVIHAFPECAWRIEYFTAMGHRPAAFFAHIYGEWGKGGCPAEALCRAAIKAEEGRRKDKAAEQGG